MNRSEEIRRFYEKNPGARPKDCIIALAAMGVEVSPTLVSCVRAKLKVRDTNADVGVVREFVESSGLDPEVAVEILGRFVDVVEKVGGLSSFREVLAVVSGPGGGIEDEEEVPPVASAPVSSSSSEAVSGFSYDDVNDEEDDD
jgi:hypothetical protein